MSYPQPAAGDRQLPRGHLLVLNRSFRRTLEAENKSPRTIEAYTDAVRLLATYCQTHGQPLLASELEREHLQSFIADQLARWKPATAHNRYRGPARLLQVGGGRGGPHGESYGWNEAAAAAGATGRGGSTRAPRAAAQDVRGRDFTSPPRHRHHPAAGDTGIVAGATARKCQRERILLRDRRLSAVLSPILAGCDDPSVPHGWGTDGFGDGLLLPADG
jgi:Phage integrase, N-terminal SAM-like domain